MKKQPQQPEQQRSDYSASALSELPDRASGDCGTQEIEQLRGFARRVMDNWPMGDVDGGELQEAAIAFGLIAPETATEPCAEHCHCAEYHGEFPVTCYRFTALMRATDGSGGHDASSEPRQNNPNAVVQDEPEGWVSVPLEPTEEMIEMGMEKSCLGRPSVDDERYVLSIWKAMLAAKPSRG